MHVVGNRESAGELLPYTGTEAANSPSPMSIPWSRYITHRTVLRVLQTGFALVLLLLGTACVIAVRGTRAIQASAETLMREELNVARLLNEVQAEETAMTVVLHRLTRGEPAPERDILLRDLDQADRAIKRAAASARQTPEGAQWRDLAAQAIQFTESARQAIQKNDLSENTLDRLFLLHDGVVRLVQDLVLASTQRAASVDRLLAGRSRELADESLWVLGTCFILALVCAALTVQMARTGVHRMEWQASELGRVSWHMLQTQEDAARRFSHELHDELGQSLAAIRANVEHGDFNTRRTDTLRLVDEAIANVRELSQLLRPVILDDFGLDAALRWLTEGFSQRTNITVNYQSNLNVRLEDQTETHLFRIAQEALTNVARHSGATLVQMRLSLEEAKVRLTIEDNGCGLLAAGKAERPSLGMVGMRARARDAGGELTITSADPAGVRITVCVPFCKSTYEPD
jgi:signal transduction histidine kinase